MFRNIDDLIENQQVKVSKKKDFNKSIVPKMFPKKGEIVYEFRYDGFDKDWQEERLREIANTYTCLSGKSAQDSGNG